MAILCPSTAHLSAILVKELRDSKIPHYFIASSEDKKTLLTTKRFFVYYTFA
ncbi:hypothetical protein [Klebsiella pneumoniae ISC21]|nr:hypothetical protein [Klebsiella pneumoniae ISC21]